MVSHHQSKVNVMDNQVSTVTMLKKKLSMKNSVEQLKLEKDYHLSFLDNN